MPYQGLKSAAVSASPQCCAWQLETASLKAGQCRLAQAPIESLRNAVPGFEVSRGWRFAPQCCAWQPVPRRCWVRQRVRISSQGCSRWQQAIQPLSSVQLGARHRVMPKPYRLRSSGSPSRDAQPFHREDRLRRPLMSNVRHRRASLS